MVHKSSDVYNKEQAMFCVRQVDEGLISHEDFIGLYEMEKTDSTSTSAVIKDNVLRLGLDEEKLRGQCYDGCRTIVGKKRGVETQIKKDVQPLALSTLCYAHSQLDMWRLDQKFNCGFKITRNTRNNKKNLSFLLNAILIFEKSTKKSITKMKIIALVNFQR